MTRCRDDDCECRAGCARYINEQDRKPDMPVYRTFRRMAIQSRCDDFLDKRSNP